MTKMVTIKCSKCTFL